MTHTEYLSLLAAHPHDDALRREYGAFLDQQGPGPVERHKLPGWLRGLEYRHGLAAFFEPRPHVAPWGTTEIHGHPCFCDDSCADYPTSVSRWLKLAVRLRLPLAVATRPGGGPRVLLFPPWGKDRSQANSFLWAILKEPERDDCRLVYADWLEEQGDPRGEFIRLQVELARNGDPDPIAATTSDFAALKMREHALLYEHGVTWGEPCSGKVAHEFRRGFVAGVVCTAEHWQKWGRVIVRAHPVEQVGIADKRPYASSGYQEWAWVHPSVPADEESAGLANRPRLFDTGHNLPMEWFSLVKGGPTSEPMRKWFTLQEEATAALSEAVLKWARG